MNNHEEIVCWVILMVATMAIMMFIAYRIYRALDKRISIRFADVPLPALGPFDGPGVSCTCEHACSMHIIQPESMVVGSNFTSVPRSKVPKVQAGVYSVEESGRLRSYLGVATRINDWLIVPTHVIVAHEIVAIISNTPEPIAHKFDANKFEPIEGDLSAMRMAESSFSKLGLTKAAISILDGPSVVSVTSTTKDPEVSFGTLINDPKVFGYVIFRGSTKGGFSGAAYMVGKQVAGIHLGGGVMNYGISASYIQALLTKPEETAEWLTRIRQKKGVIRYQRSKYAPDEAVVFVNGKYHTVDLALLDEDVEVPAGMLSAPAREVEVNVHETFPPQYRDAVEPIVDTINQAVDSLRSKNLEMAEQCSASQAQEFMTLYNDKMIEMNEKFMMLQALQDSVANRYRELQLLVVQIPKTEMEGREVLVKEIEKIKVELTAIKMLKTSANVEAASVKVIPPLVKKAKASAEASTLFDKMEAAGIKLSDVVQALLDRGLVAKVAVGPVGNAVTTPVITTAQQDPKQTKASTSKASNA